MRKCVLFLVLLLASCQKVSETDLPKINGYWEIEKVTFSDAEEKEYKINESFDFFEIKKNKGIRKKVQPQLDGSFLVNDTFENVAIVEKEGNFYLNYTTKYAKWQEKMVKLTDKVLVLENQQKHTYFYKRAGALNFTNGKTTK